MDWTGLVTALGALVTAIGAIVIAYFSYRSKERTAAAAERATTAARLAADAKQATDENRAEIVAIGGQIYELGKAVDGRLSALLKITEKAARAEGVQEGKATRRSELLPRKPFDPSK